MKVIDILIKKNNISLYQKHNRTTKLSLGVSAGPCWEVCLKAGRSFFKLGPWVGFSWLRKEAGELLRAVTSVNLVPRKERYFVHIHNLKMRQAPHNGKSLISAIPSGTHGKRSSCCLPLYLGVAGKEGKKRHFTKMSLNYKL